MQKVNKLIKMPLNVSIHLSYLYQDKGLKGKELLKRYQCILKQQYIDMQVNQLRSRTIGHI